MDELETKKRFMVREWEEMKKAGGVAFSMEQITDMLQGGEERMLSRDEVLDKVKGYFNSCVKTVIDADSGGTVTTWVRNPTKSGLALVLGVDKQTLLDYVKGVNSANKPFNSTNPDYKRVVAVEDFDILRKAYALIEDFYEQKLGENRNNAGTIYWLNNAHNTKWSNEQEFRFGATEQQERPALTAADLPKLGNYSPRTAELLPRLEHEEEGEN